MTKEESAQKYENKILEMQTETRDDVPDPLPGISFLAGINYEQERTKTLVDTIRRYAEAGLIECYGSDWNDGNLSLSDALDDYEEGK